MTESTVYSQIAGSVIIGYINSLIIMTTHIHKIPPNLPFPKGGIIPLFDPSMLGRKGLGEIFR